MAPRKKQVEGVYRVEKILDEKMVKEEKMYLIKWDAYSTAHNSWEPAGNILDADLIKEFEETKKKKPIQQRKPANADPATTNKPEEVHLEEEAVDAAPEPTSDVDETQLAADPVTEEEVIDQPEAAAEPSTDEIETEPPEETCPHSTKRAKKMKKRKTRDRLRTRWDLDNLFDKGIEPEHSSGAIDFFRKAVIFLLCLCAIYAVFLIIFYCNPQEM